jgi:hypothetical protein
MVNLTRQYSRIEAARAADKWVATLKKTEKSLSLMPDSDAHADANISRRPCGGAEPQRAWGAQVEPIQPAGDAQRRGESSGAARKFRQGCWGFFGRSRVPAFNGTVALHPLDAFERFESAQKNSLANAFGLAGNVEHVVIAIDKINIGVPALAKKRAIARCHSAKRVAGRVADQVSFGFDNASAKANRRQVVHQGFANKEARELDGIDRQLATPEAANANFRARERHAIRSIIRTVRARLTIFS